MLTQIQPDLPIIPPDTKVGGGSVAERIASLEKAVQNLTEDRARLIEAMRGMWDTLNQDGVLDIVQARINGTNIGDVAPGTGAFTTLSASGNTTLGDASTDTLNVGNGGIVKDASGNVGIGASPSTDLHITRASNATHFVRLENTTDSTASATVYEHKIGTKVAQFYMRGPSHSSQEWGVYSDLAASPFKIYNNGAVALTIDTAGVPTVCASTATPANGSASARLLFGTTAGFGIYYGSGAPTVSAAKGSLYLRSDGSGTTDRAYINTDGGTTWTAVMTVA